ncbi:acyltransferase family protein [Candidatus Microgenomates bacterium]|nr:acyltransferase family protein [Candidatus Microgenomates bacterium]
MQRTQLIDTLRGLAMLVMILTHTTVFFLQDPSANFLWNWSHFAVPIFVFCSVYLFFQKSLYDKIAFWSFVKKRFVRLLIPYYWFLLFFLIILFFTKPETLSIKYLLQSIFVIGGVDINWLVLLFMMITIILPASRKGFC